MTAPLKPWSQVSTRTILQDRWLTLRADRCRTAEGHEIAPYYVLDYPDWVQIVAFDDADRVLMIEQYRHALGIISLELPGGGVEPGEEVIDAGRRELREETGYAADEWAMRANLAPNPATHSNRCHVVTATGARLLAAPDDDPTERLTTRWIAIDEAVALALGGGVVQAMHVAALAIVLGPMGRWH